MNFNHEITALEYLFIAFFLVLYMLYIGRTIWVAQALNTTARAVVVKFFLRTLYCGLLIASLLGPFFGETEGEIVAEGRDIFVMMDVSKSMDAADVAPSRLEKAKFELQRLVEVLPENRFGLIIFSSDAFLQVPLTFDASAFSLFLQALNTTQISASGTDVCQALNLAVAKHLNNTKAENKTKILLLITDGEDFGICDGRMLAQIRQYGMHLFIVGIGTQAGGKISVGNGFVKDEDGQTVVTRLKSTYLRELATITNGQYFEIGPKINTFADIQAAIGKIESRLIDSRKVVVSSNKYRYFLVAALILLVLDVLFTVTTFKV